MPNCLDKITVKMSRKKVDKWKINILRVFEPFARKIQFNFMKKHITREIVLENFLAFHPVDYRGKILHKFNIRIQND